MKWLYEKYIAIFVDALVEEIKSAGIIKSTLKTNRILGSGWGRIPNIRDIGINLGSYNKILRLVGLDVREGTTLKFIKMKPDRMNRFMIYQMWRLSAIREKDSKKYFKIAFALMRRSVSFRVSAINHVFFNWYKKIPLWVLLRINRKVDKILETKSTLLDFSRVYIPKPGSDKFRPLGVPEPEWRLVLHMANNFIHWYLRDYILPSQHGFIPNRGSLSAWRQMFEEGLLEKPFIYECDLKQFFPSVNLDVLNKVLLSNKVPTWVVEWLDQINSNFPKLPQDKKLSEDKEKEEKGWMDALTRQMKRADPRKAEQFGNPRFIQGIKLDIATRLPNGDFLPFEEIERQLPPRRRKVKPVTPVNDHNLGIPASKYFKSRTGVPQGAPTSPFLSILILKKFLTQQQSVSYADDPIFFGEEEFKIYDYPDEGIKIHPEKSGWVKRNGEWLKPLKFLGLEFDGKILRAKTREGSTLEFNTEIRSAIHAINQLEHEMYRDLGKESGFLSSKERVLDSWYNLFKSRLIGHIVSRLYIGSWSLKDYTQDFELKFVSTSWLDLKWKSLTRHKWYTIFNASSYASWSLAEILRHRYRKRHKK